MDNKRNESIGNTYVITWGGGEPLLFKDIWEIIRYAHEFGIKYSIMTNGMLLPQLSQDKTELLKECNTAVESLECTNKADVIFVFYDPKIRINRRASPAKLYDAMICGKPVLVNSEALPVEEIVREENCGLIIPYGDIQGIRATIQKLKDNVNLRMDMGQNGREVFEREYNWTEMEARLLKLYDEVLSIESTN